jgi:hypothetical protein
MNHFLIIIFTISLKDLWFLFLWKWRVFHFLLHHKLFIFFFFTTAIWFWIWGVRSIVISNLSRLIRLLLLLYLLRLFCQFLFDEHQFLSLLFNYLDRFILFLFKLNFLLFEVHKLLFYKKFFLFEFEIHLCYIFFLF